MSGLNRSFTFLKSAVRSQIVPKASLTAKPAKHVVSGAEQVFVMTVFFVTILGPSGWVLAHLESYKKKE
ncbi:cytochrome c oxidase subunit 8B, mitochondrial [Engraulis encrasicolus]|uniref:cytochrome c oxidase subunit 8B, mitochondrial n=1 Tax=Engraulis encrasicolus TaxID=184585 RepID=UPI002FCEC07D